MPERLHEVLRRDPAEPAVAHAAAAARDATRGLLFCGDGPHVAYEMQSEIAEGQMLPWLHSAKMRDDLLRRRRPQAELSCRAIGSA